jgi:hypothetical protein
VRVQGSEPPFDWRSWTSYRSFIRALPAWRLASTTAMVVMMDAWVLGWSPAIFFEVLAAIITLVALVPLWARWGPG